VLAASRVAVVMPVLDEAKRIGRALDGLARFPGVRDVIVVDGGSTDGTRAIACERGATVIAARAGRARQLNAGADVARADVLLFLHADTTLPPDAMEHVDRTLHDPCVVAGAFRTWTVAEEPRPWFAPLLHLADVRSRLTRLPYGDQAMFVRAPVFRAVGGFPDVPLFEDLELSRRLRARGEVRTCAASVQVSGRRWIARPIFHTAVVNVFPLLHRLGVSPARLARLYTDVR
ncbi:MAG: TIGR04283 family arsenosugar biosynthesis glycosyltransferase, partial [Myxococcota bacterium]|nr:TIGR04283 family arsenosugar biosynthesis glycosyltransferase [Myxococcota bacterium]